MDVKVEFFYFGLRFYRLKTTIREMFLKRISFSIFEEDINAEMGKVIQEDVRVLNAYLVGGKNGYKANGSFVKLDDKDIYVYHHSEHAT